MALCEHEGPTARTLAFLEVGCIPCPKSSDSKTIGTDAALADLGQRRSLLVHVPPWLPRGAFPEAGEERVLTDPPEQAVLGKSHLTSMVTPDIHGCVRLDLVTGPPEKKYHPLGSGSSCCWIAWSHPLGSCFNNAVGDTVRANPCSSPCWTTHPGYCPLVVCSYVRRAEVVKLRDLEGLELASFPSLYPWCLEKWFRLTDLADGSPPRTLSLSSAMTTQGNACV